MADKDIMNTLDNLSDFEDLAEILRKDLEGEEAAEDTTLPNKSVDIDAVKQVAEVVSEVSNLSVIEDSATPVLSTDKLAEIRYEGDGSGDIDEDIQRWYSGVDRLPSTPLGEYVTNVEDKLDIGLHRTVLRNINLMSKAEKFLNDAMDILLDVNALVGLEPGEADSRVRLALQVLTSLQKESRANSALLKKVRESGLNEDDTAGLRMLLSSVPEYKLKAMLLELSKK